MHYIQKHILDDLRTVISMRYAQLNGQGIESGHFRYHLTQLVRDGYVQQLDRGLYALTLRGQQYVDKLSGQRVNAMAMPKVITYTLLVDGDTVIIQEKLKQPYIHLFNMIGGKLHEGETSQEAAIREVREKTWNTISSPKLVGIFEIFIRSDSELLTHVVAYAYAATVRASDYRSSSMRVVPIKDLATLPSLAPDFFPIFQRIHNTSHACVDVLQLEL